MKFPELKEANDISNDEVEETSKEIGNTEKKLENIEEKLDTLINLFKTSEVFGNENKE